MEGENSTSGPWPYQPYEGGDYHLPYFQHSPMGIRASVDQNSDLQAPLFEASKLSFLKLPSSPFLKLSSSPGSYTEQYHMEQIRLLHSPTKVPRLPSSRGLSTGVLTFIYRLPSPEAFPRFPGGYTFIYRLSPPETIHGLHRSSSSAKSI